MASSASTRGEGEREVCGEGGIEGGVKWRKDWNRGKGRRCNMVHISLQ